MRRILIFLFFMVSCAGIAMAETSDASPRFIHVWRNDGGMWPRVSSFPISRLDSVAFRSDDPSGAVTRLLFASRDKAEFIYKENLDSVVFGTNVPTVYIATDPPVYDITSKKDYLEAVVRVDGYGTVPDMDSTAVKIRGRGNSTWGFPKKPYRLKFSKKQSMCGLGKAKNFVLIANYLDPTHMKNTVAFKIASLLGMPYTNHSETVNVWLNGRYVGVYMLSEKVGINSGSVDIDEATGIMWELDQSFDEDYKFESEVYGLPVMVKDPDPADVVDSEAGETEDEWLERWRDDFEKMEAAVVEGRAGDVIDMRSAACYMLVNLLCGNGEVEWPKSVYFYKENKEDKYVMGPVWDFDWAFGMEHEVDDPLMGGTRPGFVFMKAMVDSPDFQQAFEEVWHEFKTRHYEELLRYMKEYASKIRVAAFQDGELWPSNPNIHGKESSEAFDDRFNDLLLWLDVRVMLVDTDENHMLY